MNENNILHSRIEIENSQKRMANLKEIRTRIGSVKSTRQITSAMKMVSAAKLRKAQQAITELRPFADKIGEILVNISESLTENKDNPYVVERKVEKVLLVVITSNRGLCGAFNSNIIKKTNAVIAQYEKQGIASENIELFFFGKKAYEILVKQKYKTIDKCFDIYDELTFKNTSKFANDFMSSYKEEKYDKVELIYNGFKNAATQNLTVEQLLPVQVPEADNFNSDYIIEPSLQEISNTLVPKAITIQLMKALMDSHASEHGARMVAMNKATDNASELIRNLNLTYNKARQAAITNEILEIVGGAEALKG